MFEAEIVSFYVSTATFFLLHCERMGPCCSSAETQVCHRSYIIAAKISPRVKTMHNGFFPPISLLNISVYRLQSRLLIDSPPYLKKNQKDHRG